MGALWKHARQQHVWTNHYFEGGNRPVLFCRVPCMAASGIAQEAPLPKNKCNDNQRHKKNIYCKWHSERRITETYSAIGFSSLQVLSARNWKHENLSLEKGILNINIIKTLRFQQQMWMQPLCTAIHALLSHYFSDETTEVLEGVWRPAVPMTYKPWHTVLG